MTPRLEIVTLPLPLSGTTLRQAVADTGHSRFPVSPEDLDELTGIVHVKDLLQHPGTKEGDLNSLIKPPIYVPETMSILNTLQDMRARRYGMAVVVDEHGGVEGIVTIKDLVSELVGELQDEYDSREPVALAIRSGQWVVDGRLDIEDLAETIQRNLPDGPYSTVGGFIMALFEKVPDEGDQVTEDGVRYTVLSMDRQRVDSIRVERIS
jgi:putative hemolysin